MQDFSKNLLDCLKEFNTSFEVHAKELLRNELEACINILLKSELSSFLDYNRYERTEHNDNYRNGSYQRELKTSFGPIKVTIPRDRLAEFKTQLIKPYKRRTDNFEDMILEIATSGLSYETSLKVINSLYGVSYSKNTIANITEVFQEEVEGFKNRKLSEKYFAIYLDGTYVPLKRKSIEKECILIALGVKNDGSKEVLGYLISPTESLQAYDCLLKDLKNRGLKDSQIFISDGFIGLSGLIKQNFPKSDIQRCLVHVLRNINSKVRPKDRAEITSDFKEIKESENIKEAYEKYDDFILKWEKKYKSLGLWNINKDELFCFLKYPVKLRKFISSTNAIESLNKEIKRRVNVRIISSENSLGQDLTYVFEQYNMNSRKMQNYDLINSMINE